MCGLYVITWLDNCIQWKILYLIFWYITLGILINLQNPCLQHPVAQKPLQLHSLPESFMRRWEETLEYERIEIKTRINRGEERHSWSSLKFYLLFISFFMQDLEYCQKIVILRSLDLLFFCCLSIVCLSRVSSSFWLPHTIFLLNLIKYTLSSTDWTNKTTWWLLELDTQTNG